MKLVLGCFTDEALAIVKEGDHGRRYSVTLVILNHLCLTVAHHSHRGICGAEVDANHNAINFRLLPRQTHRFAIFERTGRSRAA
mmetsp:Transcript_135663/g.246700  ORF Transcript_135663/g.246700 Transcript_135663/m.246700 type:complete len:84 (-) Transcript_135663:235-486(-)